MRLLLRCLLLAAVIVGALGYCIGREVHVWRIPERCGTE